MTNNKQQTEHRFCLTPELKCTMSYCDENGCMNRQRHLVGDPIEMTNNKQQTAVDSIIEFCQKQMDNDSSIHKGVYLSIIKFCEEQAKEMEKQQRSIELPTDEEIDEKAFQVPYDNTKDFYDLQFIKGAKWMRDKIKGTE
jgi:hypothetical protein